MSEIETIKRRMENTLKNDIKEEFNNNNLINELEWHINIILNKNINNIIKMFLYKDNKIIYNFCII